MPANQPPPSPGATLKLTVQGGALTSNLVPPTVTIDGVRAPAPSLGGSVLIPIPPGPHRIEASSQWMRTYGQAALDIQIEPSSTLEVFYAPPMHQFSKGAMGLTPQKRAGAGFLIGLIVAIVVIIVLIALIGALAG